MTDWRYACHRSGCDAEGMTAAEYREHVADHVETLVGGGDDGTTAEKLDLTRERPMGNHV